MNFPVQMMCEDVSKSPGMNALVGPVVGGIMRGTQRAKHKPCILRRILLIIRALLLNPHLHFVHLYYGPQNYVGYVIVPVYYFSDGVSGFMEVAVVH